MNALKIHQIGNSLGAVLPKEALSRLKVKEGDQLFLTEAPDGSFRLTLNDPDFEEQMEIAREGMRAYRNALRKLAE